MDFTELFRGIAVVIDDEINVGNANINNILKQIKEKNIPFLSYTTLPPEDILSSFNNLSFLLLDWRLVDSEFTSEGITDGVKIPATLSEEQITENIAFLKRLSDICFCPIFIFSNEDQQTIIDKLAAEGIYSKDKQNHIFVKSKNDLEDENKLFSEIESWIKQNPSIYVLKEWEKEYQRSKNQLFSDFQKLSPMWPKIMWETFEEDGVNKSLELGGLISRNLFTRMTPFAFSEEIMNKEEVKIDEIDIRQVLEGERFLNNKHLHENEISTGDIFKEEIEENGIRKCKYYLNIRAQCDLLRNSDPDEIELYCLKGRVIQEKSVNKEDNGITFLSQFGQFVEKVNHAVIPFLDDGVIIEFLFRDLKILKWKNYKNKRIGRLLPPYINSVQQRYALYLQRQGLPRVPKVIVFDKE
jgi:hypothetical protein